MSENELDKKMKKELSTDLWIIVIVSVLALAVVLFAMQNGMNEFAKNENISIVLRVLVIGLFGQFAVSGLGVSIVCLIRKQSFFSFGLCKKILFRL